MTLLGEPSMTNATAATATEPLTVADLPALIEQLGDIPPERIRLRPSPGTAREADLIRVVENKFERPCELVEGTLVEKAMGFEDDFLGYRLGRFLGNFVDEHRCGVVVGPQS